MKSTNCRVNTIFSTFGGIFTFSFLYINKLAGGVGGSEREEEGGGVPKREDGNLELVGQEQLGERESGGDGRG